MAGTSYYRDCRTCGRRIQMRRMPGGQWLAFEGYEQPHEHGAAPGRTATPAPMARRANRSDSTDIGFEDFELGAHAVEPVEQQIPAPPIIPVAVPPSPAATSISRSQVRQFQSQPRQSRYLGGWLARLFVLLFGSSSAARCTGTINAADLSFGKLLQITMEVERTSGVPRRTRVVVHTRSGATELQPVGPGMWEWRCPLRNEEVLPLVAVVEVDDWELTFDLPSVPVRHMDHGGAVSSARIAFGHDAWECAVEWDFGPRTSAAPTYLWVDAGGTARVHPDWDGRQFGDASFASVDLKNVRPGTKVTIEVWAVVDDGPTLVASGDAEVPARFLGNSYTSTFHRLDCGTGALVQPHHRVLLAGRRHATASHIFSACGNCSP